MLVRCRCCWRKVKATLAELRKGPGEKCHWVCVNCEWAR